MRKKTKSQVLILFSGGIDSTACIQWYLDLDYNINPLFIKFGQLSEKQELISAKKVCDHYSLNLTVIKLNNLQKFSTGEIPGRNFIFIANALFNIGDNEAIILGVHSGTGYFDCSEDFVNILNQVIKETTDGTSRLEAPFINWSKKQIFDYCQIKKIPIELTYSCEKGTKIRCGKCATCRDLNILYGG